MRLNTYRATFFARCPVNHARVQYVLEISTPAVIAVESINDAVEGETRGFHEDIADRLHQALGGTQILSAHHHGVDIRTERS